MGAVDIADISITGGEIIPFPSGDVSIVLAQGAVFDPSLLLYDPSDLETGTIELPSDSTGLPVLPIAPGSDDSDVTGDSKESLSDPTGAEVTVEQGGGQSSASSGGGCFINILSWHWGQI